MIVFLLLALAGFATATTTYSLTVYAPATSVDGKTLHASALGFHTGLVKSSGYCPDNVEDQCPPELGTLVYGQMVSMAVST